MWADRGFTIRVNKTSEVTGVNWNFRKLFIEDLIEANPN